jgi:LysM repeat protein
MTYSSGIQGNGKLNNSGTATQKGVSVTLDRDADKIIESLVWAVSVPKIDPKEIKAFINDNLQGKNPYLADPSTPGKPVEYFALKVYASMLKSLGYRIRIPENEKEITDEQISNLILDYQNAIAQFNGGKASFTPQNQIELITQYEAFLGKTQNGWAKEATVVFSKSLPLARILVDSKNTIPDEYIYPEENKNYIFSLVDYDPLYQAVKSEISSEPFNAEAFSGFASTKLVGFLQSTFKAQDSFEAIVANKTNMDKYKNTSKTIKDIQKTLVGQSIDSYVLTPDIQKKVDEAYSSVAVLFGQEYLDGELDKKLALLDEQKTPDNQKEKMTYILKVQVMESVLSFGAVLANLAQIAELVGLGKPLPNISPKFEDVSAEDMKALRKWKKEDLKEPLLLATQDFNVAQTAKKFFVNQSTRGMPIEQKVMFEKNVKLLESGSLTYEVLPDDLQKLGVARPLAFSANSNSFRRDLINFHLKSDDPQTMALAGSLRSKFADDVSYLSNEQVVMTALLNLKTNEMRFADLYSSPLGQTRIFMALQNKEQIPSLSFEFPGITNIKITDDIKNFQALNKAIGLGGLKMDPAQAFSLIQPAFGGGTTWVLLRKKNDLQIISLDKGKTTLPDADNISKLLGGLLQVADPISTKKDFDVFSTAASFQSKKSLFIEESINDEGKMIINANRKLGYDVCIIDSKFLSTLLSEASNRTYVNPPMPSIVRASSTLNVSIDDPMVGMVRDNPILAIKLYLYTYSNAPVPITNSGGKLQAAEEITAEDVNAYINLAYYNSMDPSKRSLSDEDFRVLLRVRDYLTLGEVKICNLDQDLKGNGEIIEDTNRALRLFKEFRNNLERLAEVQQDASVQRMSAQTQADKEVTPLKNAAISAVRGLWHLPSFAAAVKAQNMVVDSNVLALKEYFYSTEIKQWSYLDEARKTYLADTSIDGEFIEKFCQDFKSLLNKPYISQVLGDRKEKSSISDTFTFLLNMASRMKNGREVWNSLNMNPADYKDRDIVDAKRILQAALLAYQPGQENSAGGVKGIVQNEGQALIATTKGLLVGQTGASYSYSSSLKSFLLQYGFIKWDSPFFSLQNNDITQEVVNASGKTFLTFLESFKSTAEQESLVKSLESDPMNGLTLRGDNAKEKFSALKDYAKTLSYAAFKGTIPFTYNSYQSGKDDIENGLKVFVRVIMPNYSAQESAGADNKINYGATLYGILETEFSGSRKNIQVLSTTDKNQIYSDPQPRNLDLNPINAFEDQAVCNYVNFKFIMTPMIQIQMQTGMITQLGAVGLADVHGDPFAGKDRWNAVQTWFTTRAQFYAFQLNPLAWANPNEMIQLFKNGDIAGLVVYAGFFGPMAWGAAKNLYMQAGPLKDKILSRYDQLRGRQSFVSSLQIRDMLLNDPKFLENELNILEEQCPGIKNYYRACKAAGKVAEVPFKVKDTFFNPLDNRAVTWLAEKSDKYAWDYLNIIKNKIGAKLIRNPQLEGTRSLPLVEQGYYNSLFTNPAAQWHFNISTPIRNIRFDRSELESLQKENMANLSNILEKKGYKGRNALKQEVLESVKQELASYLSMDLNTMEAPNIEIPIQFRTVDKSMSAFDVFRLGLDPKNSEYIFESLGLTLTRTQKTALLEEIRTNFDMFKEHFNAWLGENLSAEVVQANGGIENILARIVKEGPAFVDNILTDDVIKKLGNDAFIVKWPQGEPDFNATREYWKTVAATYQACQDPAKAKPFIETWQKEVKGGKAKMLDNLRFAANNPTATQPVSILNSSLEGSQIILEVRNIDLLASIKSMCDPSTLKTMKLNPTMDAGIYTEALENIYQTGNNRALLSELVKSYDIQALNQMDASLASKDQPKKMREYFLKFEGQERYARAFLSQMMQENMVAKYSELFKEGTIGKFLLKNSVQVTIRKFYRSAKINEMAVKVAKTIPLAQPNTVIPNLEVAYADEIDNVPDNIHIVKEGETLSQIAKRYGTTVKNLLELNKEISDPKIIKPGQKLVIKMKGVGSAVRGFTGEKKSLTEVIKDKAITAKEVFNSKGAGDIKFIGQKTLKAGVTGLVVEIPVSILKQLYEGQGISFEQTLKDSFDSATGWAKFGATQGFAMKFMGMTETGAMQFAFLLPAALNITANPGQAGMLATKTGVSYGTFMAGFKAGSKLPGSPVAKGIYGLFGGILASTVAGEALNKTIANSPELQKILNSKVANIIGTGAAVTVDIYTLLQTPEALSALFRTVGVGTEVAGGLGSAVTMIPMMLTLQGDTRPKTPTVISGSVTDLAKGKIISKKGEDKMPDCKKIDLNGGTWNVNSITLTSLGFETFVYLYKLGYIKEKDLPRSRYLTDFLDAYEGIDLKNPQSIKDASDAYTKLVRESWWNWATDPDKFSALSNSIESGLKGFKSDMKAAGFDTDPKFYDAQTAQLLLTLYSWKIQNQPHGAGGTW